MNSKEFQEYKEKGFFVIRNVFSSEFTEAIFDEIISTNDAVKYFDRNEKLRRIEQIYNKGNKLIELNNKIIEILNNLFDDKFMIFIIFLRI